MSTDMTWQTYSNGSADTEKLGELLGEQLMGSDVIELISDLGGGKTTFVRGVAKGLRCNNAVSSPTYTLNNIYKCKSGLEIHHFDFYRLTEPGLVADQLAETLADKKSVTIIEWSKIVKDVLPDDRISINFEPSENDPDKRLFTFHYPESKLDIIKKIENSWKVYKP